MIRPIDIIGLKNFRIFDDNNGILEEMAPISILTGANNSGKSSIIKFLQMLTDSMSGNEYPFDLDLTKQEHLLGDFDNILFNKENREIGICLPFIFLGIKNFYISLKFEVPIHKNVYKAKLRGIEVIDKEHNIELLSFKFREATDSEKEAYKEEFKQQQEEYEKNKKEQSKEKTDIFSSNFFLFPPMENPLVGYIDWNIKLDKLKKYLKELLKFYEVYLKNKSNRKWLENADKHLEHTCLLPSELINSFKNEIDVKTWNDFLDNVINEKSSLNGKEHIGERDFDAEDFFYPPSEIEDLVYHNALKILKENLNWNSAESNDSKYSVLENCFKASWKTLIQRVNSINYLSTIREENSRIYTATNNSPFIKLLKDYNSNEFQHSRFINKYLNAFKIGKEISVKYTLKYQLIGVSVVTFEGTKRDLVDFGYGIKQLILILIQISVLAEINKRTIEDYDEEGEYMYDFYKPSMLLVEEPETNLHPKWQSLLADMFVEANQNFNIQFIIETHSEYLIRKFQTLVAKNNIKGVNIKIFYLRSPQNISDNKKQIETLNIEEDGSIDYHVFDKGFFDESYNLEFGLLNIQFSTEFEKLKKSNDENENKISELEQQIDNYVNKLDFSGYTTQINNRFDTSKLSNISVEYLASGQYMFANADESSDFSPIIIQYGRAIENELKSICLLINNDPKKWMLGKMQGYYEIFKTGSTTINNFNINQSYKNQLQTELTDNFHNPFDLKIELIDDLRIKRNDAGHSGQTKTKQEAINYIEKVNEFLDKWILEKK